MSKIARAYTVALKHRPDTARVIHAISPQDARMQYLRRANELGTVASWSDTAVLRSERSTVRPQATTRRDKR